MKYKIHRKKSVITINNGSNTFYFRFDQQILKVVPNRKYPLLAVFTTTVKESELPSHKVLAVEKLYFIDMKNQLRVQFEPDGKLYFSDWYFNLWSPNGKWVILQQDHYGPYHIVKSKKLFKYLYEKGTPRETPNNFKPAQVHNFTGWERNHIIRFTGSCCGDETLYHYNIQTEKLTKIRTKKVHDSKW